jgi:predicted Fe-Mo cluster-binding NifX family protein
MKIAISSKGTDLDAQVDPRFGRATHILVIDSETMALEALDNAANVNAFRGAGIQAATMVSESGAEVLMTGYCGPNAFKTLQAAGIKVVSDVKGTVKSALEDFTAGKFTFSDGANVDGHW